MKRKRCDYVVPKCGKYDKFDAEEFGERLDGLEFFLHPFVKQH